MRVNIGYVVVLRLSQGDVKVWGQYAQGAEERMVIGDHSWFASWPSRAPRLRCSGRDRCQWGGNGVVRVEDRGVKEGEAISG